jgi:serine/threonine protein kinase
MFNQRDCIDGKYIVQDVCNDGGGMGAVFFVNRLGDETHKKLVLKACRESDSESLTRFRREVKLLGEFQGNSKVVEIIDENTGHNPPYFVMRYYEDGDLTNVAARMRDDIEFQEKILCQMIECLSELHSRGKFHRDVKPQNFLLHGESVVISDLGLGKALTGHTAATRSSQYWGTPGYLPPEFLTNAGFRNASVVSDIFMLGKTFYCLLSGRDPMYLSPEGVPPPIYSVIERCCLLAPTDRYPDLSVLRQRLIAAYDVPLDRTKGPGRAGQLLGEIRDQGKPGPKLNDLLGEFSEELSILPDEPRAKILFDLDDEFFGLLASAPPQCVLKFLASYDNMVRNATYGWSYAEIIADRMKIVFSAGNSTVRVKTSALECAIVGAVRQNRFAAMDTCISMIKSVRTEDLGHSVAEMLLRHSDVFFIQNIEPSECLSDAIGLALGQLKVEREAAFAAKSPSDPDWF